MRTIFETMFKMGPRKLEICPQCGKDWGKNSNAEFCSRCGSSTYNFAHDPLKTSPMIGLIAIDRSTKKIIRGGIMGIGLLCLLTGFSLFYGGWIEFQALDTIQIWVSRLTSPLLLAQGVFYCALPFRQPKPATIIHLPLARKSR